jgi:hypothetical protein
LYFDTMGLAKEKNPRGDRHMAIIAQGRLFSWRKIEARSDLDRLKMVLEVIPDEALMRKLERLRAKGRDDYPVRAVWNSLLAGVVYQHVSVASLRRELMRNGELRELCGFDPARGVGAVPSESAYTRFMQNLFECGPQIEEMFDGLLDRLRAVLPELGKHLAIDSKAIRSAGKPSDKGPDGRRDRDGDWGVKTYRGRDKSGRLWKRMKGWFGYKVHLIVDTVYEVPVGFEVTRASGSDTSRLLPMMARLEDRHEWVVDRAEDLSGDKGYDSQENNRELYDRYGIKPIIDIRHDWKDGEETRSLYPDEVDNIVTDEKGSIFCVRQSMSDARQTERVPMVFYGFEKDRKTVKYRCPAAVYGSQCAEREACSWSRYGRIVRVGLGQDRRRFVPVPRSSYKWRRLYHGRTAVERVNSRLDVSFGFERHFIRGMKKMELRVGMALVVMLSMALGSIELGKPHRMRSLVWTTKRRRAA